MNKAAKFLISAGAALLAFQTQASTQKVDVGQSEYLWSCGACHGNDAKGNGPVAGQLKLAPTDLTQLAKKTAAFFPSARYMKSSMVEKRSQHMALVKCRFGEDINRSIYIRIPLKNSLIALTIRKLSRERTS